MKNRLFVFCWLCVGCFSAAQASPAYFAIQPELSLTALCAETGASMRSQLLNSLRQAQVQAGKKLPAELFDLFVGIVNQSTSETPANAQLEQACTALLKTIDTDFDKHLRFTASIATAYLPAMNCLAFQPKHDTALLKELVSAYVAVGLTLSEPDITAGVRAMQEQQRKSRTQQVIPSVEDCRESLQYLKTEFRTTFSEAGFLKLLVNP
jgi:hypothetical protein